MTSNPRSSAALLSFAALLLIPAAISGQTSTPPQKKNSKPQKRQHYTPSQKPPPAQPAILEDGGWSIEPEYWFNRQQPTLRGGATLIDGNFDYLGHANPSVGGELSMPAGKQNTLRLSYFRVQGNANGTAPQDVTLFNEAYNTGDYLTANYTLQVAKLSWDYLSYTWFLPKTKIHMKTLWQVQFANIATTIAAPLKAPTSQPDGTIDFHMANGSAKIFLPTFGLEFGQPVTRHFRWYVKGSGFGIPHHGDIWDAEAAIAVRFQQFELIGGERAYHFKTSPQGDQYFVDTLTGPFVGIRWYWSRQSQ